MALRYRGPIGRFISKRAAAQYRNRATTEIISGGRAVVRVRRYIRSETELGRVREPAPAPSKPPKAPPRVSPPRAPYIPPAPAIPDFGEDLEDLPSTSTYEDDFDLDFRDDFGGDLDRWLDDFDFSELDDSDFYEEGT